MADNHDLSDLAVPARSIPVPVTVSAEARQFLGAPQRMDQSTTLRMIAGLESVTSGSIFIGDREVTRMQPADRNIGMVFQNYALYPHKTVRENLGFSLKINGFPKDEIARRIERVTAMMNLGPLLDRKPKQLSGGQMQRVALGRTLARDANVFLLDEPLSNLDAKLRAHMRIELSQLHRKVGKTMIYVTHDQVEAMTMADKIVVMHDGRVEQVGTPLEIFDRPATRFVAGFVGSPEMNFLEGKVTETGLAIGGADLASPFCATQGSVAHRGRSAGTYRTCFGSAAGIRRRRFRTIGNHNALGWNSVRSAGPNQRSSHDGSTG